MTRRDDEGGLSGWGVRVLGFDIPCCCGHDEGLHDTIGHCAALGCACLEFRALDELKFELKNSAN